MASDLVKFPFKPFVVRLDLLHGGGEIRQFFVAGGEVVVDFSETFSEFVDDFGLHNVSS